MFRQHYEKMYNLARCLLSDDDESKDVVSEVFTTILAEYPEIQLENNDSAKEFKVIIEISLETGSSTYTRSFSLFPFSKDHYDK